MADFPTLPSMPTVRAGGPDALGRIDHYDLLRRLGGGGFGVVYLALDTVSGVEVALKTLHPLLKSNAEEMDLLREKFKLVSRLSHPNIATALVLHPVREVNVWDETARRELRLSPGDSVMVMRYAPGVTLSRWRRQFADGCVPLPLAVEVARQIASALDYAHGERIVHRDIKPANVMVETLAGDIGRLHPEDASAAHGAASGPSGRLPHGMASDASEASRRADGADVGEAGRLKIRVRILDFGLAAEIRSSMSRVSTETGDTSGTRPYMAPEQWLGRKQDGRTDQYALACVLYELVSGAPPFAGVFETGDPIIMRTAVERDAPDEIDGVPPAVNAALQKALSKNPKDRFATCGDFIAAMHDAQCIMHNDGMARRLAEPEFTTALPHHRTTAPSGAVLEADVLRRKLSLSRALKSISDADRADKEFLKFIATAENEMAVAEEAIRLDKFVAAAESLDRAESAINELRKARLAREDTARKAKEEAERVAREKAEAEHKAKEKAERIAREKAEVTRKEREEAERRKRTEIWEAGRREYERQAREDAARKLREKTYESLATGIKGAVDSANYDASRGGGDIGAKLAGYSLLFLLPVVGVLGYFGYVDYYTGGVGRPFSRLWSSMGNLAYKTVAIGSPAKRNDGTPAVSAALPPNRTATPSGGANPPGEPEKDKPRLGGDALPQLNAGDLKTITVGSQEIRLHWCPATTSGEWKRMSGGNDYFMMGSPSSEKDRVSDETQHRVTLTHGFWMGETEVTQGLWNEVMGSNPSYFKLGDNYPVERISWNDCQEFVRELNARAEVQRFGMKFALPTEAQWEYACRAGTTGAYGGTDHLRDMGWYVLNSGNKTYPVGRKLANAWKLYDMHGNVLEWCQDWYGPYPSGEQTDPPGASFGSYRVLRGGNSWLNPQECRSARRSGDIPDHGYKTFGLRLLSYQNSSDL